VKENNVKKLIRVNGKWLWVAVDVGKVKNTGYIRFPDGREVEPFEFGNTQAGFEQLWGRIEQAQRVSGWSAVVVGLESTGPYGEPLVHYLRHKPVQLVQVNTMHTKRLKELVGNSPHKSDRKDPRVIADIMALGHALSLVVPQGATAQLRRLTHARERAMQQRTVWLNQLGQLVFVLFPEFLQVLPDLKTKTARFLLRQYPRPLDVAQLGLEHLTVLMRTVSRGKLGVDRAGALYQAAQDSVGVREGQEGLLCELSHLLDMLAAGEAFIGQLEEHMSAVLEEVPSSTYLLSIKGIGRVTVAGLLGEVGDFEQFRTIGQITKLAGLDLFEISSGQHQGQRHISKRGRALMRKILFFAALNVVRQDGILHDTYQRYCSRGMAKKKALVAISRKLLGIMFALVRDHRHYVPEYTRAQPLLRRAA